MPLLRATPEVRLLGPLEVDVGGRPVTPTPGRLRSLLAALAMSAGQAVPVDRLATAIWQTDLPTDVRRSMGTYVARLRAAIGADAIGTAAQGYVLCTEPDNVDALRFLRLVDSARAAAGGAAEEGLLRAALALWRGAPFEGVPSTWLADTHATRLVEAHLAATERRIDLDIGRGRLAGLPAELTDLTERFPLRESLWLRLVVALDRAGSPAEALVRYGQARRRLARELGVDPGPQLRRAHADLLAGRPTRLGTEGGARTGAVGGEPPAAEAPPVPGQLPVDLEGFTGRARSLAALDALVPDPKAGGRGGLPVAIVHGPAGVGKTALAVHWAHRVRDRFPDGQLYLDLGGHDARDAAMPAAEAVQRLLESIPAAPERIPPDLSARIALYRSLVSHKRILLVLDNARDADQVLPLLPGTAACAVLVTSRNELPTLVAVAGAHPVRLDVLTAAQARRLLAARIGDDRVAAGHEAVDEIVDACAGLPLALAIVAARAAADPARSLPDLAAELRGGLARLDAFAAGDPATDLRTVFSWSYRSLSPGAARLFRRLGLWAGPDTAAPAAAALAGTPERAARLLLAELARANLVIERSPGRYTLHDLLRAFAAELASEHDGPEGAAAVTRLLGFYLATTQRTVPLLAPGDERRAVVDGRWSAGALELPDEAAALRWLDAERPNLVAAVRQAAGTAGEPQRMAPRLAQALFPYFAVRPHWDDWAQVNELALAAARRLAHPPAQAQALLDLGFVSWLRGRFRDAQARYEQSLKIHRDLGDRGGEAASLAALGDVHRLLGDSRLAIAHYEDSLEICRRLNDLYGQTRSLGSLGTLYRNRGWPARALACLRDSLTIREKLGDRRGQATSLSNLGAFHHREGAHDEALTHYRQSLAMRREQGDRHGEGTSLAGLGAVHQAAGRPTLAAESQRAAVTIFRDLADEQCLAENLRALAATLRALGETGEAGELTREAAEIFARLGTPDTDPAAPAAR